MNKCDLSRDREGSKVSELDPYSIENDNIVSLEIYHCLLEAFHECEQYAARHLNVVAIFFHHLMRLLAGSALKSFEIKQGNILEADHKNITPLNEFPYVGYYELINGRIDVQAKGRLSSGISSLTYKMMLINIFSNILKGRKKVALVGVNDDVKHIVKMLVLGGVNPCFETHIKVYIPRFYEQIEIVNKAFYKIVLLYNININASELMEMFVTTISPLVDNKARKLNFDLLLTGTMTRLETRVVAAGARSLGKPVVAISHGEGDLLCVDEPRSGYGEMTFATSYIGYGCQGKNYSSNSFYMKSLYEQPFVVSSNSNICKRLYRPGHAIVPLNAITDPVFMYVPNNFIGQQRYGPFHGLPDSVYREWQNTIHELFPCAIYKKHPKEDPSLQVRFMRVERCALVGALSMADVFILDCYSTAFNIVAATNKPIIYFDIGIRNIHQDVQPYIKERTIWVDARNNKSVSHLQNQLKKQEDKLLVNFYTENFCITDSDEKREDAIVDEVFRTIC